MRCKKDLARLGATALVGLLSLSQSASLRADVKLPAVFGSGMVLQRDIQLPVWGWAEPGEEVTVRIAGQEVRTKANDAGKWSVKLAALAAPGPYQMSVQGKNTVEFKDVLVGEVWVCSGQSNMDFGMNQVFDAKKEVSEANCPNIRLFELPYKTSCKPETDCDAKWRVCTPENLGAGGFFGAGFSGVAYYFGREIQKELGVPVGLIKPAWGGTRIEPWTPPEGFASEPKFADVVKRIEEATPRYKEAMKKATAEMEAWLPKAKEALAKNELAPAPPEWPKHELDNNGQPTGIYNAMIHPIVPYAIRGALWYQGEANRNDGLLYTDRMRALIGGWRKIWGEGDFPFLYVQIAPFRYNDNPKDQTMVLWEAQTRALSIPNTGMVVTTDLVDNIQDIHPKNKKDVGKRLALWALAKTYGHKDLVFSGPLFDKVTSQGAKLRVHFQYADNGLKSRDGKPLTWFEVAGADGKYVEAKAEVDQKNTLLVWSDQVKEPVSVRFGWNEEAMPNLVNAEGLPASPFRSSQQ